MNNIYAYLLHMYSHLFFESILVQEYPRKLFCYLDFDDTLSDVVKFIRWQVSRVARRVPTTLVSINEGS